MRVAHALRAIALDLRGPIAAQPMEQEPPLYSRWWFWAGATALVAGAVIGTVLLLDDSPPDPDVRITPR